MRECVRWKGKSLKTFGWNYLESRLPKEWTNRLRENSRELVSRWPAGKNTATPEQVQKLLCRLGIDATNASKVVGKKEEIWKLAVRPTAKGLADYLHPIAAFGTKMKSPLQVIFLYGNYTERQLVDTVTSLNLGSISIVFIDRPIDAAGRRYIGEIFHTQKTGQNPFLLVDQVLLLYLAMHQETERLPAMLKCTLPYTAVHCITKIITEMCVMEVTKDGLVMTEINPEFTVDDVKAATEADFTVAEDLKDMTA